MSDQLLAIARQFANSASHITPLGNGLINDTFLVKSGSQTFVLQRINTKVFPNPEQIMTNLVSLSQHIAQKNSADVRLQLPQILSTVTDASLYQDEQDGAWRALSFIADSESLETVRTLDDVWQTGQALGHFHRLLSDLEPGTLHDTLPGFHITPGYLQQYRQVLTRTLVKQDAYCAEFIDRFQHRADDLEAAKEQGVLPLRVIHGDPKLNNFLFDRNSLQVISLIDLDTVKPGLVHYDVGDCARSCCHNSDTGDFDIERCGALLTGYLSEAGAFFTDHDYQYLYPAIRLIPFELGLRFYTDYLQSNCYFKVTEPEQNLRRAAEQFRLCESIQTQESVINSLIAELKPGE
ncbi:MAG: aminoglycoside phosphotransferase family protein [Methylococcaceae bacterium]|nr:aminoglycoside phosphotransferase family protein [Methylococcaceae bacterium]MDP3902797.1 aminoglycoside phosphotransferase family protein [Methylococcaceae bacterium]